MSSSARLRAHQASQSTFTLRQARLTTSQSLLWWADRTPKQAVERTLDPPRVGAGEVERGDQRLGRPGPALVAGQRLRAPFAELAGLVLDARPRHAHRRRAERAREPTLAPTVTVALAGTAAASVAAAPEEGVELLLEQRLDGGADVPPQPILDRVVVDVDRRWRARVGVGHLARGVSFPAMAAAGRLGSNTRR